MRPWTLIRHLVTGLLCLSTGSVTGLSQEAETSALQVLRSQVQAQAEELARKLQALKVTRLGLNVSGSLNTEFTSNAFVETFEKHGLVVSSADQGSEGVVDVLVLAQGISYDEPASSTWKRTARTALEARLRRTSTGVVEYLGSFDVSRIDLVSQKEEGWWGGRDDALLVGSSPGALEKILIPITIIAATAVIVYLFFTVRN